MMPTSAVATGLSAVMLETLTVLMATSAGMTAWWQFAAWLFGGMALLVLLAWLHVTFWTRRLTHAVEYAETLRLPTPDGSAFELRHLLPEGEVHGTPVLLVHGIAINHRNMDSRGQWSLARCLAAAGRDVWLLTLRSGRHDLTRAERRRAGFAAMVEHDVPMAVREILDRTQAQSLDYVGFSMGGMLLYAALGRTLPEALVRRAVILGSPGRIRPIGWIPGWAMRLPLPNLRLRLPSRVFAFASEWVHTPLHASTLHLRNAAPGLTRHTMVDAVQDIPSGLLRDFRLWAMTGGTLTVDGKAVLDGLRHIKVPAQFIAGSVDRLGPVAAVRAAYDAWGEESGAAKRLTIVGRAHGQVEDYGHGDLAIGERAPTELYPLVAEFLNAETVFPEIADRSEGVDR